MGPYVSRPIWLGLLWFSSSSSHFVPFIGSCPMFGIHWAFSTIKINLWNGEVLFLTFHVAIIFTMLKGSLLRRKLKQLGVTYLISRNDPISPTTSLGLVWFCSFLIIQSVVQAWFIFHVYTLSHDNPDYSLIGFRTTPSS